MYDILKLKFKVLKNGIATLVAQSHSHRAEEGMLDSPVFRPDQEFWQREQK